MPLISAPLAALGGLESHGRAVGLSGSYRIGQTAGARGTGAPPFASPLFSTRACLKPASGPGGFVTDLLFAPDAAWGWRILDGDAAVGRLDIRGLSMRGVLRRAEGETLLRCRGLFRQRIHAESGGLPLGSLTSDWRAGGTLALADGRTYAWKADNFSGTRWTLSGQDGVVARLRARGALRWRAEVELAPGVEAEPLVLPLAMAWYGVVMLWTTVVIAT